MKKVITFLIVACLVELSVRAQCLVIDTSLTSCGGNQWTFHICTQNPTGGNKRVSVTGSSGCINECFNATQNVCKNYTFYSNVRPSITVLVYTGTQCSGTPCVPQVLPVSLASFTLSKSGSSIIIKWETASEQNAKEFSVERSLDGEHWTSIAVVASKAAGGNSQSALDYDFIDVTAVGQGMIYYRLKQTDRDGKFNYSSTRAIRGDGKPQFTIRPNPSTGGTLLLLFGDNLKRNVSITDPSGNIIKQWDSVVNLLQITGLSRGFYVLVARAGDGSTQTAKIIVE